jgi:ABC-type multidrug transport system ATPase subunit
VTGAGKSTTFKCLTGETKPTNGEVHVNGFDVTDAKGFENARR